MTRADCIARLMKLFYMILVLHISLIKGKFGWDLYSSLIIAANLSRSISCNRLFRYQKIFSFYLIQISAIDLKRIEGRKEDC